jgi:hypothetical protein
MANRAAAPDGRARDVALAGRAAARFRAHVESAGSEIVHCSAGVHTRVSAASEAGGAYRL